MITTMKLKKPVYLVVIIECSTHLLSLMVHCRIEANLLVVVDNCQQNHIPLLVHVTTVMIEW